MNVESGETRTVDSGARGTARQILLVTAVISTVFGALYLLGLVGKLVVDGSIHSASSPSIQMVSAAIGLLWDSTLVIMFVALRRQIAGRNAVWAELGLVFMALMGATSSINWFAQLTLVPRVARAGESAVLALIDIHNNSSIMYAIEHLGWGVFVGLATIFMALAIDGGRVDRWIRWLFVVFGALSLLHVLGIILASPAMTDLGYWAAGVLLPIATALLALRSRRN